MEAGKMVLEENEFDVVELLEQAVDLYYPVAIRKNVDMVLDFCDDMVRFRRAIGDREKLKKVLWNLLGNAVKFTSEGHVTVRASARKPRQETKLRFLSKKHQQTKLNTRDEDDKSQKHVEPVLNQSPNYMEFWFEVDDTGIGIPKEKRDMVFENYVQVKEQNLQLEGTGLGLGIVQSLVRLMSGEIEITDKPNNERGTCFRFNVLLLSLNSSCNDTLDDDIESGLVIKSPTFSVRSPSPRMIFGSSPTHIASHVVLLISGEERRRICHDYIKKRGIKVSAIGRWDCLHVTLVRIKRKHLVVSGSSSDTDTWSERSRPKSKDIPWSCKDEMDQRLHDQMTGFVLLVIDANAGPFQQLEKIVSGFRKGLSGSSCKVVWLGKPTKYRPNDGDEEDDGAFNLLGPLHGIRLRKILQLLPEFGGGSAAGAGNHVNERRQANFADIETRIKEKSGRNFTRGSSHSVNVEGEEYESKNGDARALHGSRCLVVEDNRALRKVAGRIVSQLGGTAQECGNGQEAVALVRESLRNRNAHSTYSFVLMDSKMPVMDGYEATKEIRLEAETHGIRVPVIAVSAESDELRKMEEAGADAQIVKPLSYEKLLKALNTIKHQATNQV